MAVGEDFGKKVAVLDISADLGKSAVVLHERLLKRIQRKESLCPQAALRPEGTATSDQLDKEVYARTLVFWRAYGGR